MKSVTSFDRFLLSVAPKWALERIRARNAVDTLARHYEAAAPGRRTSGWARTSADANLTALAALAELRIHARDLVRNNAWARRARSIISNNAVGWGIVPKPVGDSPATNAAAAKVWREWASTLECETEGRHTFYGLQALVMRHLVTDGEVLIRRRPRQARDGFKVPLQLQVLEADFLDHVKNSQSSISGGPIVQGVEFNKIGQRTGYWLYDTHPGSGLNIKPSRWIPAEDVLHIFDAERANQVRGVSWFAAAIINLKDLDEYDDAELVKQKVAACFAAFVTDADGASSLLGAQDANNTLVDTLEPGMISHLPPGKQVVFGNPPTLTSDSLPNRTLRRIAAALGVTFEDLTGDYSQVNFSSARMARIAHWGNVHNWQENLLIPQLCSTVWDWVMTAAFAAGYIDDTPASAWTVPPMPMLEPDKEGLAYSRLVRNGVMTYSQMVREQGGDPETHWAEYAADQAKLDVLKIKLDSDVRAVSAAGLTQERANFSKPTGDTGNGP